MDYANKYIFIVGKWFPLMNERQDSCRFVKYFFGSALKRLHNLKYKITSSTIQEGIFFGKPYR